MAAPVILVEASPRRAADGVTETVRIAGGGGRHPYFYGGQHWRAGIVQLPTFITAINFEGGDFGEGGVPQATELQWAATSKADLSALAGYFWIDAMITVRIGPENAEGTLPPVALTGKVLSGLVDGGALKIQLTDPAADLKKPLLTGRYAGTGGLEGPVDFAGKIKDRVWGRVWNKAGEPIDKANNIYVFADPLRPLQAFDLVRDKGAPAASLTFLAWQGTAAATLAALQAAVAPAGGGVVCPSIACVKWWTQPAGDLTADLRGEIGAGYVETTAEIVQRIVSAGPGTAFAAGTIAAALAARPAPAGWVAKDDNTTVAATIEELLGNSSLLWLMNAAGEIVLREWAWGAPAATATSHAVKRTAMFRPVATRTIGYQRNEKQMARGDLAGVVLWGDVTGATKPEDYATRNDDGANMIRSPLTLDEATYTNGAVSATFEGAPAIQLFTTAALGRWGPKVPCRPGETLFHSYLLSADGPGSETVNASYSYFDANGGALGAINLSSASAPSLNSCNGITATITFSFQVPSTAYFIQIYIERPVATGQSFFARQPYLGRSAPGATVGAVLGVNVVDPVAGMVPTRDEMIPGVVIDAREIENGATRGAILDPDPDISNFRLGDGTILSPDLVLTELGTAADFDGSGPWARYSARQPNYLDLLSKPGQNALFNGSLSLGWKGWSPGALRQISDYRGNVVEAPVGIGGTHVAINQMPINMAVGSVVTLSAIFTGAATTLGHCYVLIQFNNGNNNELIGFSASVGIYNETVTKKLSVAAITVPAPTDGSNFVRGYVKIITVSDIAYVNGTRWVEQIKVELGPLATPFSDEATNGAVLGNSTGQIPDSRNLNISNSFGLPGLSLPCPLADTVIGGQLYLTIGAGSYSFDGGVTVNYPSATLGPGPFGLFYHVWANVPVPGQPPVSYDASPDVMNTLGTGKHRLGGVQARANAGAPPETGDPGGAPIDNGGGYFIP